MPYATQLRKGNELNRLYESDRPVHEWYRFVLSFPPHLVRNYIEKFDLGPGQIILDPFLRHWHDSRGSQETGHSERGDRSQCDGAFCRASQDGLAGQA